MKQEAELLHGRRRPAAAQPGHAAAAVGDGAADGVAVAGAAAAADAASQPADGPAAGAVAAADPEGGSEPSFQVGF